MKIKTLNKKLVLNKETISHLDYRQMNNAAGGGETLRPPCPSFHETCETEGNCPTNPIICTTEYNC